MLWYVCIHSCSIYMYVCIERKKETVKAEWQETMGEMGRKTKEVVKDKKVVSPRTFVAADIWNVFSYHSISKLPGMVWYGMVWQA